MIHNRIRTLTMSATMSAAVAATLGLSACGAVARTATEHGVEQLIESSVDDELAGFDIDIDLSDGDFSIDTDDGTFSFDDGGNVVLGTDDGVFSGQVDESGIEITGDDGSLLDVSFLATWDDWPAEVPRPSFDADEWITGAATGDELWLSAGGSVDDGPQDAVAAYIARFDDAEIVNEQWGDAEAVTITTDDHLITLLADIDTIRGGATLAYSLSTL